MYSVDSAGEMLKDDTTVIVSIDAELDHDGFTAAQNKTPTGEFPVTIDNTPPQILSSTSDGENADARGRGFPVTLLMWRSMTWST